MRRFLTQYWFLLALLVLLAWGTKAHASLTPLTELDWLRDGNLFLVMLVMVLPLEFRQLWDTIRRPLAPGLAIAITYGLAPFLATLIAPLIGPEFGPGLLVAAALPCTMASAAVWTRRAGGNDAIALTVTAVTNFSCFLVLPLLLRWMIGAAAEKAQIDTGALSRQLFLLVVVPIVLGQLLRLNACVASFAARHKLLLSNLTQIGVLFQVFLGAIQTGNRWSQGQGQSTIQDFALMVAAVSGLHLLLFVVGYFSAQGLRLQRGDAIAVGFSGSQKTLMVGLQVAEKLGFSIMPLICYHVLQLFYDTLIAERFRQTAPTHEHITPAAEIKTEKTLVSPKPSGQRKNRKQKPRRKRQR